MILRIVLSAVAGYAFGMAVTAIIVSHLFFKEDVRDKGSGNSGATNAARVYGLKIGVLTYAGDFLKGVLACLIGRLIGGEQYGLLCLAVAGSGCILGHCFPVIFKFRGGKGVSVGSALALMLDWRIFVCALAVFILLVLITKIVSVGSIGACVTVGVTAAIFTGDLAVKLITAAAAAVVIAMHHGNIARLIKGTEKKMTFGKSKK
ncbi:MAG: glycerol-3-phosphate 1-O-acyltransferase PlsY [Clostridia bacterium]|nr:glycerol-3-phosphate 1-O-acyltransferase PlsY [Clostridia bacterium]